MARKQALGRGLGALIDDSNYSPRQSSSPSGSVSEIEIDKIITNPNQPRTKFDEEALKELAASIKELGIIQPITVKKVDDKFQLISGERRLRASKSVGLKNIPAYIRTAEDETEILELALVENIQREDLDAIEIGLSYQRLLEECNLTQEALSKKVGKKRATIANYVRLLKLPAKIQLSIRDKELSMGHARSLLGIEDTSEQIKVYKQIIEKGLSVRQTEEIVRLLNEKPEDKKGKSKSKLSEEYTVLQDHLSDYFKSKIKFKRNAKGNGQIVIPFKNDGDLERIIGMFDNITK